MKIKMMITQDIIDRGECESGIGCAFALAYNELVPEVWIGRTDIRFYGNIGDLYNLSPNSISKIPLTEEQVDFIIRFDDDKRVKPTEFEVEIPDEVIDYWYKDASEVAQKIADSKILQLV